MSGATLSIFAFVLWGLIPLYFQFVPSVNVVEFLSVRIIVSIPLMLGIMWFLAKPIRKSLLPAIKSRKVFFMCLAAGVVNCISLYSMTWALTNGHVLAVSLGYFINPVISIVLGVLFLKDRLTLAQKLAVVMAFAGIAYQVIYFGELPWLSLIMGSAFALYGLIKKYLPLDPLAIMLVEFISLLPIAGIILGMMMWTQPLEVFSQDLGYTLIYLGAIPVTLIPLIIFSMALERTSLTIIGLTQYIEPSLQFILALLVFSEPLDMVKLISFSCIWLGLIACSIETLYRKYNRYKKRAWQI